MEIKTLPLGEIAANCYLVSTENAALVIDPGEYSPLVASFLKNHSKKERMILLTHCHFDHIGGARRLREETNTDILICKNDAEGLNNPQISLASFFGIAQTPFLPDITVNDGDVITVGDLNIKCLATPGHSKGSMSFLIDDCIFSGDTLFKESIGRTDFPTSNYSQMKTSLKKLAALDENIKVFSGHGEATTIKNEVERNPFLRGIL